eukprot:CAMPEP_0176425114 /NCGR_PEP_ID=MMETSP0127-20121128/11216_1 /TAXON_ID=938130 /ORGANISM="Platyophrya macrostoma, Strain WH" /LENGTH=514 /DNA_ID=CAMNT_0017806253 /DNA_START=111 /DNA_END=1655 /DNA_ORIENTATION=+
MESQMSETNSSPKYNGGKESGIEENTTFYYSNFKLFNEKSEQSFTKYLLFKNNLKNFLGEDWINYSKAVVYKLIDGNKVFPQGDVIFNSALEVWLELRREINNNSDNKRSQIDNSKKEAVPEEAGRETAAEETKSNDEENQKSQPESSVPEMKFGDFKIVDNFDQRLREKLKAYEIDETNYNAVIKGFYISAIRIWEETLESSIFNPLAGNKNEGFVMESKKYIMNKLQNLYNTKSRMLKPILVATEKMIDFIYEKPKKVHSDATSVSSIQDEKELKNLENFNSNYRMETCDYENSGDLKDKLNNLSLAEGSDDYPRGKRRNPFAKRTVIEVKKINKKTEKMLNHNLIEFSLHHINNIVKTTNKDWQITRNFVTNMVEVNYNRLLQFESRMASELKNEIKIRFIQPAQGFYNHLMETWIIFKTNSLNKEILFTEYLEKVKASLGVHWSDRFVTPTQNFFMTLYYEWNHLKQVEYENEEKLLLFVKKVKENMSKTWEENIVKKAEELMNKKINYN